MEALVAALEPIERSVGWVVAPTYDLSEKVFREIVVVVAEHLRHRIIALRESDKFLRIRNMSGGVSEIRGKSADNPVSLLGEGLSWCIVDEAARMKPAIWESHLSQRLIDKKGWALLISTPRGKGWFYELYRRGQSDDPDYESWNYPSWTNPYLDAELIEQERSRLPERVHAQEFGGAFIEGAGSVFRNVRECAIGEFEEPVKDGNYYAGLDLAKIEDHTVLTIVRKPVVESQYYVVKGVRFEKKIDDPLGKARVVFIDRFHRLDWSVQLGRIHAALERFGNPLVSVDSTGAGEPLYEAMVKQGLRAVPYPFTQRSKADLINCLALMLERRELIIPRPDLFPPLVEELDAFQYSVTDAGSVKMGAPSGCHDDAVISLALAAWEVVAGRYEFYSRAI